MLMPYFHSLGVLKSNGRGKSVVSQSRAFFDRCPQLAFRKTLLFI